MNGSEEQHKRLLEMIKNYKFTDEDIKMWKEWLQGFHEYMNKETHEGDCYCARCMSEFVKRTK